MVPDFLKCRRRLFVFALALPLIATVGCQRGPRMYQVSGKVHYKDGSVPRGGVSLVNFRPTKESTAEVRQGASGAIGPDGSFTMYSRVSGDGVYAGDYAVTFTVIKGPMDPTSLILPKYNNSSTPPFTITVDENKTDLDYEIEPLPGVSGAAAAGGTAPGTSTSRSG
jgi:hypothetical protein